MIAWTKNPPESEVVDLTREIEEQCASWLDPYIARLVAGQIQPRLQEDVYTAYLRSTREDGSAEPAGVVYAAVARWVATNYPLVAQG